MSLEWGLPMARHRFPTSLPKFHSREKWFCAELKPRKKLIYRALIPAGLFHEWDEDKVPVSELGGELCVCSSCHLAKGEGSGRAGEDSHWDQSWLIPETWPEQLRGC